MEEKTKQLKEQKLQCDVRNSRQRIAMRNLIRKHNQIKQENKQLKDKLDNVKEYIENNKNEIDDFGYYEHIDNILKIIEEVKR